MNRANGVTAGRGRAAVVRLRRTVVGVALCMAAVAARADTIDQGLVLLIGDGTLGSHLSDRTYEGVAYDWALPPNWGAWLPWQSTAYGEVNVSHWRGCTGSVCGFVNEIGVSPVFRHTNFLPSGDAWYLDFSVGAHIISPTRIANQVYSTAFQFGEFAGVGWLFGSGHYDLGLRYQHESNSDWKTPNDGMNFVQLRLAYSW